MRRLQRGMTLIEIIVVITIIAMITAAVAVSVIPKLEEAKQDTAKLDIKNIEQALKLYYAKKGNYPDTGAGLKALVDTQNLDKIPVDPWGSEYQYMLEAGKPLVSSYGKDKQAGGEGADGDINNRDAPKTH
ncbi:MAG: type II secretion system protein GspG [Myxococcaceae bacterium]